MDELIKLLLTTIENNNYGTYHIGTEDMSYCDRLIQILDEKKIDSTGLIDKKIGNIIPEKQHFNTTKARNIFGFEFS